MPKIVLPVTLLFSLLLSARFGRLAAGEAQLGERPFSGSPDHPAIGYRTTAASDPIAELNRKLLDGRVRLRFDTTAGYLRSVLDALNIPVESQIAVFSRTSLQSRLISPNNPRTLYFNGSTVIGWVRGGVVEAAAQDPRQGVIFYTLEQTVVDTPAFQRRDSCLRCHETRAALDVPGLFVRSVATAPSGMPMPWLGNSTSDHRSRFTDRWSGWYVTGRTGSLTHLGNTFVDTAGNRESLAAAGTRDLDSLRGRFETDAYLSPYSDVVALMVFEHQLRMINLLTRIGWETRVALHQTQPAGAQLAPSASIEAVLDAAVPDLVDYLLFVDETQLPGPVQGTSGFAERFAADGPRDKQGRSLRQLDLERRLMRYPCSYLIYSDAFDALPAEARDAIYRRMWRILSGEETGPKYACLTLADRRAVVEILRDTKKGLPDYFGRVDR